jgi:hypothetical protein
MGDLYWDEFITGSLFSIRGNKRDGNPNANGKYGLADRTGKIVIAPQFDKIYARGGMIGVDIGFKSGFVNGDGEYIIPAEYDYIGKFNKYDTCVVSMRGQQGQWQDGIIDKTGRQVVPLRYEDITILGKDRFSARTDKGYGLFDMTGTSVTKKKFGKMSAGYDHYAFAEVKLPGKKHLPTGKIFRQSCGEGRYKYFHESYPCEGKDRSSPYGLMKEDGTILTPEVFGDTHTVFSDGLFQISSISINAPFLQHVFIDTDGNLVLVDIKNGTSFINGTAYISMSYGVSGFLPGSGKDLALGRPLNDNIETFFINKRGDIVRLSQTEQRAFLREYLSRKKQSHSSERPPFLEYTPTVERQGIGNC